MNAKARLWQFLSSKGSATNVEIASFMRGSKGQLSWGQRLRELRQELQAKGKDLDCKALRPGIYLYTIVNPEPKDTEQEASIRHNNLVQETMINTKQGQGVCC